MPVICGAIRCQLALRNQTEPTPAEDSAGGALALIDDLEACADMQRKKCAADGIFTASSSFGGDAVDDSTATNNPSPVGIQRLKPG